MKIHSELHDANCTNCKYLPDSLLTGQQLSGLPGITGPGADFQHGELACLRSSLNLLQRFFSAGPSSAGVKTKPVRLKTKPVDVGLETHQPKQPYEGYDVSSVGQKRKPASLKMKPGGLLKPAEPMQPYEGQSGFPKKP